MIAFAQDYGLWIVLVGVFVAMHWFGRSCCGGGHHESPTPRLENDPEENLKVEKSGKATPRPGASCH